MAEHNSTGTIERGIRKRSDKPGYDAYITVDGRQRWKYFPAGTPVEVMREWRWETRGSSVRYTRTRVLLPRIDSVPPPADGKTWIYFAQTAAHVKIGHSKHPVRRIRDLQVSHPTDVRLVAVIEGNEALERELHERFKKVRRMGEWFSWTPELRAYVESISRA
jgi:hypothetical protein